MFFEHRMNGGKPSIVLIPNKEEIVQIDKLLGDCGAGPIELKGYLKLPDDLSDAYIHLWNPLLNPEAKVPTE